MSRFNSFEEIAAWQKARELTSAVYRVSGKAAFGKDYGLRDQIRRAAVSVMSNIAEGFERGSDKEFTRYLVMAKGSAGEVRAQLYIATDQGYISAAESKQLSTLAVQTSRMIAGLIRYLRQPAPRRDKPEAPSS